MGETGTILVVDDEEQILELIGEGLAEQGNTVLLAADGTEALRIFHAERPQVVLMDLWMPGVDGLTLMRAIKQARPRTEILILTGHADIQSASEAVRWGAFDYISKPFELRALVQSVQHALGRQRLGLERDDLLADLEQQVRIKTTALERAEDEREALRAQRALDDAIRMVAGLAAGAAHDFATLLTIIRSSAQFLLESLPVGDPHRADAERIDAVAERGRRLVQELMAFSGTSREGARPVDLADLVQGWVLAIRPLLGHEVRLEIRVAPSPWPVQADPEQIERLVMNLLLNARDAILAAGTPVGGTIAMDLQNVEVGGASSIDARESLAPGQYVMVAVSDTGCGMSPEVKRRVFEPFFTTKNPGSGTGLGLAAVSWIASRYNGCVRCDSVPGQGSSFRVYLPRAITG